MQGAEQGAEAADAQSPVVAEVIASEVAGLLGGAQSLEAVNAAFLESHGSDSLRHRAAAAEMALLLAPAEPGKAAHILLQRGGLLGAPDLACICGSLCEVHITLLAC